MRKGLKRRKTMRKVRKNTRRKFRRMRGGGRQRHGLSALVAQSAQRGFVVDAYVDDVRNLYTKLFGKASQSQVLSNIYTYIKVLNNKLVPYKGNEDKITDMRNNLLKIFTAKRPDGTVKVNFDPGPLAFGRRAFDLFATTTKETYSPPDIIPRRPSQPNPVYGGFCPVASDGEFILQVPPNQSDGMDGTEKWIEGTDAGYTHLICVPINNRASNQMLNDLLPLNRSEVETLKRREAFIKKSYGIIKGYCDKPISDYLRTGIDEQGLIKRRIAGLGLSHDFWEEPFSEYLAKTFSHGKNGGFVGEPWNLNPALGMFKMSTIDYTKTDWEQVWKEGGTLLTGIQTPADSSQLVSHCHVVCIPDGTTVAWPEKQLGSGGYVDPTPYIGTIYWVERNALVAAQKDAQ